MYLQLRKNKSYLIGLITLVVMMISSNIVTSHVFLGLSLAVPGLGAGLGGALFGSVGLFWGAVAGVASAGAGVVVGA